MKTASWFLMTLLLAASFVASSTPARAEDDSELTTSSWQHYIQGLRRRGNDME